MATRKERGVSTFTTVHGNSAYRGISTVLSGTTIVAVTATAARSGAVILTQPYMFAVNQTSGQSIVTQAASVGAGTFSIICAGSAAPRTDMPVAWTIVR